MMRKNAKQCSCARLPHCFGAQYMPAPQDPKLQHWIQIDLDQHQQLTTYQCPICKTRWQEQHHTQGFGDLYTFYCLSDSILSLPSRRQWWFYTSLLIGLLAYAVFCITQV